MKRPNINMPINFMERYKARISLIVSIVTLAVLCLVIGQLDKILVQAPKQEQAEKARQEEEQKALAQAEPDVYTATFAAVGDNRLSNALIDSGYSDQTGAYNFDHLYSQISEKISRADFALVNQETVFTEDGDSYSGEDTFATPTAVGDSLAAAGFDGIASATDHIDDYGASMIQETLDYWNASHPDIKLLGIHPSQTEAGAVTTVAVNGINIALLNYTDSSYTSNLGTENSYMVDSLDQTKVSADIAQVKESSDAIIVIANWGDSEAESVSEEQRSWAQFFLSQGVLVTIGMNPREVQPMETLTDANGNSMLVYYSLGNFVSTQGQIPRLLGGLASFTIEKSVPKDTAKPASVRVSAGSLEPLVMHYDYDNSEYAVYPLENYTDSLAAQHSILDNGETFNLSVLQNLFQQKTGSLAAAPTASPGAGEDTGSDSGSYDDGSDGSSGDYDDGYDDSSGSYDDGYDDSSGGYDDGYDDSSGGYDDSYDDSSGGDYDDGSGDSSGGDYGDGSGDSSGGDYDDGSGDSSGGGYDEDLDDSDFVTE